MCLTPAAAWLLVSSFLRVLAGHFWAQITRQLPQSSRYTVQLTVRTFVYFNSLVNPIIYCWRQKEMRQFVFSKFWASQDVHPAN